MYIAVINKLYTIICHIFIRPQIETRRCYVVIRVVKLEYSKIRYEWTPSNIINTRMRRMHRYQKYLVCI